MHFLFVVIRYLLRTILPEDQGAQPALLRTQGRRFRPEQEEAELQRMYAMERERVETEFKEAAAAYWRRCWGAVVAFFAVLQPRFWKQKSPGDSRRADL